MKKDNLKIGYSLVEVLVSISILLIAIMGPITIVVQSLKSSAFALQQNTAYFLAQEGAESFFHSRNSYSLEELDGTVTDGWVEFLNNMDVTQGGPCDWSTTNVCSFGVDMRSGTITFTSNQCLNGTADSNCLLYYDANDSPLVYSHNDSGSASQFTRIINVTNQGHMIFVKVEVLWQSEIFAGTEQSVKVYTTLFKQI